MCILSDVPMLSSACYGEGVFGVRIHNDVGRTVEIRQCDSGPSCDEFHERVRLNSGESHPTNVSLGATQWFRIVEALGDTVGCRKLRFSERSEGAAVNVSRAESCAE